jgi:hypothetical protein
MMERIFDCRCGRQYIVCAWRDQTGEHITITPLTLHGHYGPLGNGYYHPDWLNEPHQKLREMAVEIGQ